MILGIAEDFTSEKSAILDAELKAVPDSGLYANSGVHPSITLDNLLAFLPFIDNTFTAWNVGTTYGVFTESRNRRDIVVLNDVIYQSIAASTGQSPDEANSQFWIATNLESLRLKEFLKKVEDRVLMELNLTHRLINNQYVYEEGIHTLNLPENYSGWAFEPKGSDYAVIRINQIALTKAGTTPVNMFIVNQGEVVDTFTVTPDNGKNTFVAVNKKLTGFGPVYVVMESTDVLVDDNYVDPLKYDGALIYPVIGIGSTPETADYRPIYNGNGLGFNFSVYLDSTTYVLNNLQDLGNFVRATLEYMAFQTFFHNPNNRSNRQESIQMRDDVLMAELKDLRADTVITRFYRERKKALKQIEKTLDTQLSQGDGLDITTGSV